MFWITFSKIGKLKKKKKKKRLKERAYTFSVLLDLPITGLFVLLVYAIFVPFSPYSVFPSTLLSISFLSLPLSLVTLSDSLTHYQHFILFLLGSEYYINIIDIDIIADWQLWVCV